MVSILLALLALSLMIFLHELGHFVAAKLCGMQVDEFAIGFGKKLLSKKFGKTVYSLRSIPLGGFNAIPSLDNDVLEKEMTLKTFSKRFLVLFAGSGSNLVSAYVCVACMLLFIGTPMVSTTIASVSPGYAAEAYLEPNDRILAVNSYDVRGDKYFFDDTVSKEIRDSSSLAVMVERDGTPVSFNIQKEAGKPLGITYGMTYKPVPVTKIIWATNNVYGNMMTMISDGMKKLAAPDTSLAKSVAGPIGVTQSMYRVQGELGFFGLCFVFSVISINLGLFNLLPIPALDGGHIFLQSIQFVTNGRLKEAHVKAINYTGLALLGCLFVIGIYADIHRLMMGS